jgi:hypothetical protein
MGFTLRFIAPVMDLLSLWIYEIKRGADSQVVWDSLVWQAVPPAQRRLPTAASDAIRPHKS